MHRRRAARLVLLTALASVVSMAANVPQAAGQVPTEDVSEPAEPPGDATGGELCERAPWVVDRVCDHASDVIGGGLGALVGGGTYGVLSGLVRFVVDGAAWLLEGVAGLIDSSTRPQLRSGWFRAAYQDMAVVAGLGMLPFLLLALLQALVRQDVSLMLRTAFAYVPLAAVGTAAAIVVVDLLVELTDELSAWVGRGIGADLSAFAAGVGTSLAAISPPESTAVAGLAALLAAAVIAFAAFALWLELLLRQAAIYVAVLFFPLAFMAMLWQATAHWVRRLAQGLAAIILSKFVIVAIMALATAALDADIAEEGFAVVISGASMLAMAALAPYVLLRLIPVFDAGLSSQLEGTYRRPTAAVAAPVTGRQITRVLHQRAGGHGPSGAGGMSAAGGAAGATGAAATGGAATAATGAAATARGAAGEARRRAVDVADRAASSRTDGKHPRPRAAPASRRAVARREGDERGGEASR